MRETVLAALAIGYSTGPSGGALLKLFERWGMAESIRTSLVQAPPGTPLGTLIKAGDVELGFQQMSELVHVEGVDVIGPMPPSGASAWSLSELRSALLFENPMRLPPCIGPSHHLSAASAFTAASASSLMSSSAPYISLTAALSRLVSSSKPRALEKAATVPKPVMP